MKLKKMTDWSFGDHIPSSLTGNLVLDTVQQDLIQKIRMVLRRYRENQEEE